MAYVELAGVGKSFVGRTGQKTEVLSGVDLSIEEGEFVSLIGHSGCGKSTLLNLTAGFVPLDRGVIRVAGAPVRGPGPDRMVAFQNHSLLPWLTLRENVALAVDAVHGRLGARERAEIVARHLAMVYLTPAADRFPGEVSGGMKQRCGLARAFATTPKMLLLDEPFGALDALTRANLQDALLRMWERERVTVMMVTHDVDEALLLSDRIVMMSNGPRAHVAEVMTVDLARPRNRLAVLEHPAYYRQRGELIYFLNQCRRASKARPSAPAKPRPVALDLEKPELVVGFVPLLDCAPFAVAQAEGLFARNQLKVTLSREPSWKAVADGVREGRLDAAQMVAGLPLAETLGSGARSPFKIATALTLSRGGNAITFGNQLVAAGVSDRFALARHLDERHRRGDPPLVFGVTHPASMHNLILRAWLAAAGIEPGRDLELVVIPPPLMVANLERGNVAGFCVGEPWNTRAVRDGLGKVVASDADLWPFHPEKVLGVARTWADANPRTHLALVRALVAACELCDDPDYRKRRLPALLADGRYVGGPPDDFVPALTGPFSNGLASDDFVLFSKRGANLTRTNEAAWILESLVRFGVVGPVSEPAGILAEVYLEQVVRDAVGSKLPDQEVTPLRIGPLLPGGGAPRERAASNEAEPAVNFRHVVPAT